MTEHCISSLSWTLKAVGTGLREFSGALLV